MLFIHINKKIGLTDKIIRAEQAALNFIISNVNTHGGWSDFITNRSGESTSWVTAYILSSTGVLLPNKIRERASKFLLSERNVDGFWGFSKNIPSDLDSTVHALFLLYRSNSFQEKEISEYIESYQKTNGGFATYSNQNDLLDYRNENKNENFEGWLSEHICVTALTLKFLLLEKLDYNKEGINKALKYLINEQNAQGYWNSYWWNTKYYSTDIIIRLLDYYAKDKYKDKINSGLQYILESWKPEGWWDNGIDTDSPCIISTSRCINSLIHFNDNKKYNEIIIRTLDWILEHQKSNGSWVNKCILRIPKPDTIYPEKVVDWKVDGIGVGSICSDNKHLYTTASILNILRKIK